MKKFLFLSIVAAIAVAMTFVACKKQEPKNTEEAIPGTEYILVTTPDGAKGIKKGEAFVVQPKADYAVIVVDGGMFVAQTAAGHILIDPETGKELVTADSFTWRDSFFEAKSGENYVIYIPAYKLQFEAKTYAVKGNYAVGVFENKVTVWQEGKPLIENDGKYSQIAILPDGKYLVLEGKKWKEAVLDGITLKSKTVLRNRLLRKYKAMTGWDDNSPVMILE